MSQDKVKVTKLKYARSRTSKSISYSVGKKDKTKGQMFAANQLWKKTHLESNDQRTEETRRKDSNDGGRTQKKTG